ncbi:unnamed protein product [Ixodes persulcatus]
MRWAINKARPPFPVPHPSRSRNANRPFFANHGARNEPSTSAFSDVNLQHRQIMTQELARCAVRRREIVETPAKKACKRERVAVVMASRLASASVSVDRLAAERHTAEWASVACAPAAPPPSRPLL